MNKGLRDQFYRRIEEPLGRIERHPLAGVSLFSILYFVGCLFIASMKLVWNDELFTYYIARLPHLSDVWKALATGAEQTPPLSYVITRADLALFGGSAVALRLPEILAFWVMGLCLFYFVAKRSSVLFGFVAMLFPLVTVAQYYATEARAYALVLGFAAFALLCWRWAIEGPYRRLALAGLAASLAAAIACHYYAVLVLVPFGLGEVVRALKSRKIDWAVWAALIFSLTPLLVFLPLIESARKFAPTFWAKPQWSSILFFFHHFLFLPGTVLPLLAILFLVMFCAAVPPPEYASGRAPSSPRPRAHEVAAALGFVVTPAVGVILGKTVVGAFDDRYALPAVIGLSIIVAWGLDGASNGRPFLGGAVAIMLCGVFVAKEVQTYRDAAVDRTDRAATYTFLEKRAAGTLPIVIAEPGPFVELSHRPPAYLRARLLYLADPALALQDTGTDDIERGVVAMKHWAGMNVVPFPAYLASGRRCYIYVQNYPDQYEWLLPEIIKARWKLTLVGWQGMDILFSARPGPAANVSSATH